MSGEPMQARSKKTIRVGTRGSRLALAQTAIAISALETANPGVEFEAVVVSTRGDRNRAAAVAQLGVGVYVKEIEEELESGNIDMAAHSLKDMTSELGSGFHLAAVLERGDPRDALISRHDGGFSGLPRGASVGTGSMRRRTLLKSARPDLRVEPIRGNVETRLSKASDEGGLDAVVLAAAGLHRLERDDAISEYFEPEQFVPAVGQGAIALETLESRTDVTDLARSVDHAQTRAAVTAERAFLATIRGGCSAPTSAHAVVNGNAIRIHAFAADKDASSVLRASADGDADDPASAGIAVARKLLDSGAPELMGVSPGNGDPSDA